MTELKTIWLCAKMNFQKWPVTPRIYTLAAVIAAFSLWVFSWISDYASTVDIAVSPWVFPYLLSTPIMFIIYGCLTMLLFCDAPFIDRHTSFLIIRMSRRNWVIGQLIYIILASFIYTAFFVLMSVLVLVPNVKFTLNWGTVLKTIAFNPSSSAKYGITSLAVVGGPIMSQFSAIKATLISFGLFWLVSIFIGLLIFCFNIVSGKMYGLIAAAAVTVMSYFAVYVGKITFGHVIYYISPLNWSSMDYLDWSNNTGSMPSPGYAMACLAGAIILMSFVSMIVFCKKDIHIQERKI